jgi:hypothetical protein
MNNKKVIALKSICTKIDEKIKVIETKLFSETNDVDKSHVGVASENKEKKSIYTYNIS